MSKNNLFMFKGTTDLETTRPTCILTEKLLKNICKIIDKVPIINFPVVYFEDYDRCIFLGSDEHPDTYRFNPWKYIKGKIRGRIITVSFSDTDYIHVRISESPFDFNYAQEWHENGGYRIIKYDAERDKFKLYIPKEKPTGIIECFKTDMAKWQYSMKLNS